MDVEDDLRNLKESDLELPTEENEEEQQKSAKRKKLLIVGLGLFMIILLVIYLVPGNYILSIVEGQAVSYKLNPDFTIDLKNGERIVFDEGVYEDLKQLYFAEQVSEFKACLEGNKQGNVYNITGLTIPETFSRSFSHVSAELCDEKTIISLHTHPYKHCIFSFQDIRTYDSVRKMNPEALIGLMCEADRFNFYKV